LGSATPIPETPIQVVHQAFSSIDQLAEANAAWDLDWRQLDCGRLKAEILRAASGTAIFECVAFNRRFAQRGSSPSGRLTLGLIEKSVGEIGWCRKSVSTDDLLVFSPGGDNECVSRPGFRGNLVSYSEERLEKIAEDLVLSVNLGAYREGGIALKIDPDEADDLRRRLRRLERAVTRCSEDTFERRRIRLELEHEIPVQLLHLIATDPPEICGRIDGFKMRAAQRARDYIETHAADAPAIQVVCRAAGVSWRALNYAFREVFGVTPKQYLQATRLDGVRRELHRRGPAAIITDVANMWGFWHMGRFAADYRRQFGELPSQTLRHSHPHGRR